MWSTCGRTGYISCHAVKASRGEFQRTCNKCTKHPPQVAETHSAMIVRDMPSRLREFASTEICSQDSGSRNLLFNFLTITTLSSDSLCQLPDGLLERDLEPVHDVDAVGLRVVDLKWQRFRGRSSRTSVNRLRHCEQRLCEIG